MKTKDKISKLLLKNNKKGFTMIELLISITIFSIIIIIAFDVLGNISGLRAKISTKIDVNSELHFSIEKIAGLIKQGGDIDYEEYWNRMAVGTQTLSGHYQLFSGFGNYGSGYNFASEAYGDGYYYCRSGSGSSMGTGGCLSGNNSYGNSTSLLGVPQRYGEYAYQFIDYNSNQSDSGSISGDEDQDGNITGDQDDENLGQGPLAFSGTKVQELYLIRKGSVNKRVFFRWNVRQDPNISTSVATCSDTTGSGCLGNIQILKLDGKDLGFSHTGTSTVTSIGRYDGLIDTWVCDDDYKCSGNNNLPKQSDMESLTGSWVDIFPDYINVKNVSFYIYPNKDYRYAWKEDQDNIAINSYVRLKVTLGYSWGKRKKIGLGNPEVTVVTTVNLTGGTSN